jgi:hypothetical protein
MFKDGGRRRTRKPAAASRQYLLRLMPARWKPMHGPFQGLTQQEKPPISPPPATLNEKLRPGSSRHPKKPRKSVSWGIV